MQKYKGFYPKGNLKYLLYGNFSPFDGADIKKKCIFTAL